MSKSEAFSELAADAQRQALSSVKQSQDLFVRAAELAVETVDGQSALRPSPRPVVEAGFDFAGQVLDLQRSFALRLVDVLVERPAQKTKA